MKNFKVVESDIIFSGKVFDIQIDKIQYDSGNTAPREVVLHNGGSVVVAVTNENKIIIVKQYRYPFNKWMLELPAGKIDKDEDPLHCAGRELTEETGYKASNIEKLGAISTTPGFCTEMLHIYLATGLTAGEYAREEGEEGMEILELPIEEIKNMIMAGEIIDGKTIAGIFYFSNLAQ